MVHSVGTRHCEEGAEGERRSNLGPATTTSWGTTAKASDRLARHRLQLGPEQSLEVHDRLRETLDAFGQLVVRHPVLLVHGPERGLVDRRLRDVHGRGLRGIEL